MNKTAIYFILTTLLFVIVFLPISGLTQNSKGKLPAPKNGNTYVIAHRGVHIGIPENSLAAYQKAIDIGCDYVEVDARSTKDGVIVSVHNSTVDAYVKGITGRVNDFTLEEIKKLDIGSRVGPEWKDTRVATMEEVIQLCQGKIGIYLDLKEPLVEELVEMIKKYDMEQDVVWCIPSRRMDAILKVKELCPNCIPMPDPGNEKNVLSSIEQAKPLVIAPVMGDFSETYVPKAHAKGVKVFLDEDKGGEKEWNWILNLGTDGIQTDNPEALIKYIKSREK